jgi:hypothetical protein
MVEAPKDILVIRKSVQCEHGIKKCLELLIARPALTTPHGFVKVLGDHLCQGASSRLEAHSKSIAQCIHELVVQLLDTRARRRGGVQP